MEKKYNPRLLLISVAHFFESKGKMAGSASNEEMTKYTILVEIKDVAFLVLLALTIYGLSK